MEKITTTEFKYTVIFDSRTTANGMSTLYIRFSNPKIDFNTGIKWPKELFDPKKDLLLPRFKNDPDVEMLNLKVSQYKSIIHKIALRAFVDDAPVNSRYIVDSLKNQTTKTDFIAFAFSEIYNRCKRNIITYETNNNHKAVIMRLTEFFKRKHVGLEEMTLKTIQDFNQHYYKKGLTANTIASYHKVIKTYINEAVKQNLIKENPYDSYKFKFVPSERSALTQDEVKNLMTIFRENQLEPIQHEVLRRFLFSCLTGLRISDTHRITDKHIQNGKIVIKPYKGRKNGKILHLPLAAAAKELIEGRTGFLFHPITDQAINRNLKIIGAYGRLSTNVTFHTSRYTFGTIFIELGGDVQSLCDLMGHHSITITQIYLKMADQRKAQLMANFDKMF